MKKLLLASLSVLFMPLAQAEIYTVFRAGADWGGGSLGKTYFLVAGQDEIIPHSNYEVRGGGLFSLGIGAGYKFSETFTVEGTIGYKFDTAASDAYVGQEIAEYEYSFDRYPIEIGAYYWPQPHYRIGGGLTYHIGVNLNMDDQNLILDNEGEVTGFSREQYNVKYDPALGAYVEVAYKATQRTHVGIRYTYIQYETSEAAITSGESNEFRVSDSLSGNSIGISIVYGY